VILDVAMRLPKDLDQVSGVVKTTLVLVLA